MLNPNNDRLDYGQILAPPAGYNLDFAVGTTYSLNLDALVGASLALGLSEETDSELMNNPVCLLEALRSTGDNVALFCEGGQIHMPNRVTPLYILLEKMVFSVKTPKRKGIAAYPSFHPKFWLIRYRNNDGDLRYRVIVLSRNLTFDRNWDIAYYMDGHVTEDTTDKNEPVCDFLRYLAAQLPNTESGKDKARKIRALIRELPNVIFEPAEKAFYDYEFIPNGVRRASGGVYQFDETDLFKDTFHEILIISPFLSGGVIRDFNDRNTRSLINDARYMLITREMSLGRLKPEDVSHFQIYTMRDAVIDGETAISDESQEIQKQDIHAKIYMIPEKDGSDNPFQEVTLQTAIIEEEDEPTKALDAVVKEINRSNPSAVVYPEDEEYYSASVHFEACDTKGYQISIRPLLSRRTEEFLRDVLFTRLTITQLSEFYVIGVSDGEQTVERILIIPTDGLPDDREKQVVSSVVNDRDCFYRYIAFLLGDDSILSMLEINNAGVEAPMD